MLVVVLLLLLVLYMFKVFGVAALWWQRGYCGNRDRNGHLTWDQLVVRRGGWRESAEALRGGAESTMTQTSRCCRRGGRENILIAPTVPREGFMGNLRSADGDGYPSADSAPAVCWLG